MRTLCEHCLRAFDSDQRSIAAGGVGTHDFLDDPEHPTAPVKKPVDSSVAGGTDTGLAERDQIIEEFAEMPQAVPQSEWKRLGIGYGPLSGQVFPEACAFELSEIGPQGEPLWRYSEDQPRDPDGKFGSGFGTTHDRPTTGEKEFKLADGRTLTLSNDPDKKIAEVKAFAKDEAAKLPAGVSDRLANGATTAEIHKGGVNGYTQERVESFHKPTIDAALSGHESQSNPKMTFVGGGPAAGKTTATDEAARSMGDHVALNVDTLRSQQPEFHAMLPDRLMQCNQEAGDMRDSIINGARDQRYNVIIDGVGSKGAAEGMATFKAAGYSTSYVYVHRETADAVERANDRPFMTSKIADVRIMPPGSVDTYHNKARESFGALRDNADEVKVIDKSDPSFGKEGKVVFHRVGNDVRVRDAEGIARVENGGRTKISIY